MGVLQFVRSHDSVVPRDITIDFCNVTIYNSCHVYMRAKDCDAFILKIKKDTILSISWKNEKNSIDSNFVVVR